MLKNKKANEMHALRKTRRTREGRVGSLRHQCLVNLRNLSVHRAWTSKEGKIYSKRFDSKCKKDNCPQKFIEKHNYQITEGVTLRIYWYVKEKKLYFSIDGEEYLVSTCGKQELNSCYGFVRLSCEEDDSQIEVSFPGINDEGTNSFVVVAMTN